MKTNRDYVGIIFEDEENKVLFQLRDNKKDIPYPNRWSLFGGGIEQGETPEEAILREVDEELNLKLDKKKLQLLIKKISRKEQRYVFYYKLKNNEKTFTVREGQDYIFIKPYRLLLKRNIVPSLRLFLCIYPLLKRRIIDRNHIPF